MADHPFRSTHDIWLAVSSAEQDWDPDSGLPVLTLKVKDHKKADWLQKRLYKKRAANRRLSMSGLDPSDPKYGRSPWDDYTIRLSGKSKNILEFWKEDHDLGTVEVVIPAALKAMARKKGTHGTGTGGRRRRPKSEDFD